MMPEHIDDVTCGRWGCISDWEVRSVARDSLKLLAEERVRVDLVAADELGVVTPPVELPLLEQLRMAAERKGSRPGRSGGSSSGVPVDLVAVELLGSISRELHWDAIELLACEPYAKEDLFADALAVLGRVDELPAEVLAVRGPRWRSWVVQIQTYLAPERRTPVQGKCPSSECGASEWFTYDEDGGRLVAPAMVALWEGEQIEAVMCNCCFEVWPRHKLWELGGLVDPNLSARLLAQ